MQIPIHSYFDELISRGGSDLHLSEGECPKIRLHGEIALIGDKVLEHDEMISLMQPMVSEKVWKTFNDSGDVDFAYEMGQNSRFRCNFMKQQRGFSCVFRLIPTKIMTLDQLNMPEQIKRLGEMRSGLVLMTGPTGSGKSTTLAALIDHVNTNLNRHIITIEEPIEFVHPSKRSIITQREVQINCPSFADGLRASLREDADIVLVGEMRDKETISLALTAAETGLLVFGTLHTNNARKTVDRIIDVFPAEQQPQARTMLAGSLRGVVAQLLMKRQDRPGRVAVTEILFGTPAVGAIIREGATQKLSDVITGGKGYGMQFMDDDIWSKLQQGLVSPEEAYMKCTDKKKFQNFLPAKSAILVNSSGA